MLSRLQSQSQQLNSPFARLLLASSATVAGAARRAAHLNPTAAARSDAASPASSGRRQLAVVVGLELHAQVVASSKLFSTAPTSFAAQPNTCVTFLDAAYPGTLPVLNQHCVDAAVRTGIALNGTVQPVSAFDRKHYYYGDLPLGYQITQQRVPVVTDGWLDIEVLPDRASYKSISAAQLAKLAITPKRIRIQRLQLEQDSGKSLHDLPNTPANATLVDLNRAGSALMEIVTAPDLSSAAEAAELVRKLQLILQKLGTCDGVMAEGSLRVDANISIDEYETSSDAATAIPQDSQPQQKRLLRRFPRVEVKNINSIRFLQRAIQFEVARQTAAIELGEGDKIVQETRRFDAAAGVTVPMRTKEGETDYRYMPEPDLPLLRLTPQYVESMRKTLPELPDATIARFCTQYELARSDAAVLVFEPHAAEYFEAAVKHLEGLASGTNAPKTNGDNAPARARTAGQRVCGWITSSLMGHIETSLAESPVKPSHVAELVHLIDQERITSRNAKALFADMCKLGELPAPTGAVQSLAAQRGFLLDPQQTQNIDPAEIDQLCQRILDAHPKEVAGYRAGRNNMFGFLVSKAIAETQGKVKPQLVAATFKRLLGQ